MKTKPKRLPRLWCALQGLLPLEACLAAQRGELAWPPETEESRSGGKPLKSTPASAVITVKPWSPAAS